MEEKESRFFNCVKGKIEVTIGDAFDWKGVHPGKYTVKRFGNKHGIYSPAGLGGTSTIWVENEKGEEIEWCGDSVALGVSIYKI